MAYIHLYNIHIAIFIHLNAGLNELENLRFASWMLGPGSVDVWLRGKVILDVGYRESRRVVRYWSLGSWTSFL